MEFRFKLEKPLEARKREGAKILAKYVGHIPVVLERSPRSRLPDFEKKKLLCKTNSTVAQFLQHIRKHFELPASQVIFLFVNGRDLVSNEMLMSELYNSRKDEDGFLYIMYSEQEVLGTVS
jgi:GABA(A) receptor-associated protein